jgi:ERO1-like protein alpha
VLDDKVFLFVTFYTKTKPYTNILLAENGVEYSYINLLRNGERYTGYKGEHANRVWKAIYEQPCFKDVLNAVTESQTNIHPERRVFYKLISGMHSSITAHIVGDYLIDEATDTWGPNLEMFKWRLGNPHVKDRVENLYFTYLFVLRAVMKASPILERVDYDTASPKEDAQTQLLLRKLLNSSALKHTCPVPFDEGRLWKGEDAESLRSELQGAFRNITRIMDCVGCEKCKMWGKLQLLGIATSLKVLFSTEDCTGNGNGIGAAQDKGNSLPPLVLERNEVIALVNLLERLSASVEIVRSLSLQLADRHVHPQGLGAIQDLTKERLSTGLTS